MREIQTSKEEFSERGLLVIYWHETGCHENLSPIGGGGTNNDSKFRFHQNSLGTGEFILGLLPEQ